MDIHKPKPWHGVREFLKEYVIIVVGVLTALAAEQGVEWLHWRHQAEVTEARLEAEMRTNLLNAYGQLINQRCYNDRLAALAEPLRGRGLWRGAAIRRTPAAAAEILPPYIRAGILTSAVPPVYMSLGGVWPDGSWTAALASGVTLHMDQARTDRYARLYRTFATMRDVQTAEAETAAKLSQLAFDCDLSDADRTHFLEAVGQLSFWNVQMAAISRGAILSASAAGIELRRSEVEKALENGRHYFLTQGCAEAIPVPVGED